MPFRSRRSWIAPALALLAALAGCSPETRVLARVGQETITVAQFLDESRGAGMRYAALPPDSAKARLLDDMVRRSLLFQDAMRRPWADDTVVRRFTRLATEEVALEALHERLAPAQAPVSEAEARRFHAWRSVETHVQLIYTFDRAFAEAAMEEIRRGVPFAEVADRYNSPGLVPQGGDIGFMVAGQLVSPLDRLLRDVPFGRVLGPIEGGTDGWFIVRVLERRPRPQPPFEDQVGGLMETLRQRKQRALLTRGFKELRALYDLRVAPGAGQVLFQYYAITDSTAPPVHSDLVLARYRDAHGEPQEFTLGDAISDSESAGAPPNVTMVAALELWLESRVYRRIAWAEARRRHLLEEPTVAQRLERRVRDYLVEGLYEEEIVRRVEVTDDDVRGLYARIAEAGFAADSSRRPAAFDELPDFLRVSLRDQAVAMERDRLLREHTDMLHRDFPVTVDRRRLERLPWSAGMPQPIG